MRIEGSTVLVTGANRGIGRAFVEEALNAGAAKVYVGARGLASAEAVTATDPERTEAIEIDITNADQVAAAAERCGDLTILINNAGVFGMQTLLGAPDMSSMTEEITVNYLGTLSMCRAFAPALAQNAPGCIVNVLSAGAIVAVPEMGGYSPSKFALRAASDCLRAELSPSNVHVSSLIVGSVDTRMAEHVQGVEKESPNSIARAGLAAVRYSIPEHDTDPFAIGVRASLARDPAGLAASMARGVQAKKG